MLDTELKLPRFISKKLNTIPKRGTPLRNGEASWKEDQQWADVEGTKFSATTRQGKKAKRRIEAFAYVDGINI